MAALIRHGSLTSPHLAKNSLFALIKAPVRHDVVRCKGNRAKQKQKQSTIKGKWEWSEKSLSSRGFLRPLKAYDPPKDASEKLDKICRDEGLLEDDSTEIKDLNLRFKLFSACADEFGYHLPNSVMFTMQTVGDLRKFYQTPIDTTTPLESNKNIELPANLHIQYDYHRFNPETDNKFGGKTAFPKSSTLVTSIKYKKKYPSLILESPWS